MGKRGVGGEVYSSGWRGEFAERGLGGKARGEWAERGVDGEGSGWRGK